jgi:hypothetical protein
MPDVVMKLQISDDRLNDAFTVAGERQSQVSGTWTPKPTASNAEISFHNIETICPND